MQKNREKCGRSTVNAGEGLLAIANARSAKQHNGFVMIQPRRVVSVSVGTTVYGDSLRRLSSMARLPSARVAIVTGSGTTTYISENPELFDCVL